MATINLKILDAAHADGLLPKRLSKNQALYLHPSALKANEIYWTIADLQMGADFQQLEKLTKLHENTIKQFVRWMLRKQIVYTEENKGRYLLFTQKRYKPLRTKT